MKRRQMKERERETETERQSSVPQALLITPVWSYQWLRQNYNGSHSNMLSCALRSSTGAGHCVMKDGLSALSSYSLGTIKPCNKR